MEEKLLQKIVELSQENGMLKNELDAKEKENQYLKKELESLRPQQSKTQTVLGKRKKLIKNGIKLQEEIENNTPRKSGKQKYEETLARLKSEGKV